MQNMKNLFIGLLLVYLEFNINLGTSTIGLFPDFIGYIFIIKGLNELADISNRFYKIKTISKIMAIYSSLLYAANLVGFSAANTWISFILSIAGLIASLYISFNIVMGVKDIERIHDCKLNSETLFSCWKLIAAFSFLAYIAIIFPVLAIIALILDVVFIICFLVSFNKTKNLYYDYELT